MKVYYYCSYTKSPVGFRVGVLDTDSAHDEVCQLSGQSISPFIWRCFSQGSIRKACGLIPDGREGADQYFVLLKSKNAVIKDEIEYFVNIAFVTEQNEEYESWLQGENHSETFLFQSIVDTMALKGSSEFGFEVRAGRLKALANERCGGLFKGWPKGKNGTYFELTSSKTPPEQLIDLFEFNKDGKEYIANKLDESSWILVKKKQKVSQWIIPVIVAATIAVLLLFLSTMKQNPSTEVKNARKDLAEAETKDVESLRSSSEVMHISTNLENLSNSLQENWEMNLMNNTL